MEELQPMEISIKEAGALAVLFPTNQEAMINYIERFGARIREIVMINLDTEDPKELAALIDNGVRNQ